MSKIDMRFAQQLGYTIKLLGIVKRDDGRVGTRNYVAIVSTVNCSASVSQFVTDKFRDVTRDYPNIDGVLAITHKSGCGTQLLGEDHLALQRVLAGWAKRCGAECAGEWNNTVGKVLGLKASAN